MNAQCPTGAPRLKSPARASAMFVAVALTAGHIVYAQQTLAPVARNADTAAANTAAGEGVTTAEVQLLVGRSTLLNIGSAITRVSLTSPTVADAMVTTPSQLLIHGKTAGTISMFVWDKAGGIKRYEVVVRRDLSQLVEQMKQLFPGEPIEVHSNGKDVVISGVVSSKYVVDKASEVAAGYVEKKDDVVNLLRQAEGVASDQVMLRVRFAEVSRTAMTELGVNLLASGFKDGRWFGRTTTQQFAAPQWDQDGKTVFSDFLNLFLLDSKNNLSARGQGAADQGALPEPGRAEPDRGERQGSELPGRRRVSLPRRAGAERRADRHDPVQGIRRPPPLHADHRRRRPGAAEGRAGGELPRLRQRREHLRLPRARPSRRAARRRKSSCRTARRSRLPVCSTTPSRRSCRRFPASATSRSSATCSRARRRRRTRPSSSS